MVEEEKRRFWRRTLLVGGSVLGILAVAFNDVIVPLVTREIRNALDWGQDAVGTSAVVIENVTIYGQERYAVSDEIIASDPRACGAEEWIAEVGALSTHVIAYFDLRSRRSDVTVTNLSVQVLDEAPLERTAIANCASGGNGEEGHHAYFLIGESGQVAQMHFGAAAPVSNDDFSFRLTGEPLHVEANVEVDGPRLITWQLVAEYVVDGKSDKVIIGERQHTAGMLPGDTELTAYDTWTVVDRNPSTFQKRQDAANES